MNLFPIFRKNDFFQGHEQKQLVDAIKASEMRTSGEIRMYIESRCRYVDPLDRAAELFWNLKMDHTEDRNAVLVYVAIKDHQYAVYADKGIHEKVGQQFWEKEVEAMGVHFRQHHIVDALMQVITDVGEALAFHFPYDHIVDRNELPDDIIFGN